MSEFNENYLPRGLSIDLSRPTIKELHGVRNWLYINEWIKMGYFTYEQLSDEQRSKCSLERFNKLREGAEE